MTHYNNTIYNLTFLDSGNNIMDYIKGIVDLSNGLFGTVLLVTIYLICYVAMGAYPKKVTLIVSGFITTTMAMLFLYAGWIGTTPMIVALVVFLASIYFANHSD